MADVEHYCSVCGDVVFRGSECEYEYPPGSGNIKSDVEGEYEAGAGRCDTCGEYLCACCGGVNGGTCEGCREKQRDSESEGDYIPF
ncbi:MAG: hypothetical protein LBU85_08990 [Treponema sp.]|jgi:hypothetical protein|nr:hypothetical protein [Treponema sp.]